MEHGKLYKYEKIIKSALSVAQYKCTFQVESSMFTSTKLPSKALITTVQTIPEQINECRMTTILSGNLLFIHVSSYVCICSEQL